ncbi:MASE1 domain-containing protein [Dyella sp. 333MFSha]|uniref:MASE1 domain-containing protein n=1 Tax=Dyella sp. 333MFSha TaxID=1798240 RepID=UPI000B81EF6F|nr:MASE1 domain-containing protein [Dyella sp. 333MFSha]
MSNASHTRTHPALSAEPRWISGSAFLAVAAAYAAVYEIARYISPSSQWNLMAGLRLAAILLVPRRYWPALIVGEWAPLIQKCAINAGRFGLEWAILGGIPLMIVCMPLVMLARRRGPFPFCDGEIHLPSVLLVAAACALGSAVVDTAGLSAAIDASRGTSPTIYLRDSFYAYLLGDFCGMVPVVPALFALKDVFNAGRSGAWRRVRNIPLTSALVALCLAGWIGIVLIQERLHLHGAELQALRLCAMLPVLALTLRFGWQGGALAGVLALAAVMSTAGESTDVSIIEAQVVMCIAMAGALLIGMPIARRTRERHAGRVTATAG